MNTLYDVLQLLKRFGIYIYTKDRLADLEMMEYEIKDLYNMQMIDIKDFRSAVLILKQEQNKLKN